MKTQEHERIVIDGHWFTYDQAKISIFDRALLYGYAVFEVMRTYNGVPFAVHEHVERLHRSAALLSIKPTWSLEQLESEIQELIRSVPWGESYIRVMITGGISQAGLEFNEATNPSRILWARPLRLPNADLYTQGVQAFLVECPHATEQTVAWGAKASNYVANIVALQQARARGAYEAIFARRLDSHIHKDLALMADRVELLEGATSNLFAVVNGFLITPPSDRILEGITRNHVLKIAERMGLRIEIQPLMLHDVLQATEMFFTSTLREIVPIVEIQTQEHSIPIGNKTVGECTEELMIQFRQYTSLYASRMVSY